MYNSIEYSDNYAKTSWSLFQYCRDEPALNDNGSIVDFANNNTTDWFKFKQKITGHTGDDGTKNVKVVVPLKYLSNFWGTFEVLRINCEITLDLTWSGNCVVSSDAANQATTITNTKRYVPVVTLSTQDNAKLLQSLKSGFRSHFSWFICLISDSYWCTGWKNKHKL